MKRKRISTWILFWKTFLQANWNLWTNKYFYGHHFYIKKSFLLVFLMFIWKKIFYTLLSLNIPILRLTFWIAAFWLIFGIMFFCLIVHSYNLIKGCIVKSMKMLLGGVLQCLSGQEGYFWGYVMWNLHDLGDKNLCILFLFILLKFTYLHFSPSKALVSLVFAYHLDNDISPRHYLLDSA